MARKAKGGRPEALLGTVRNFEIYTKLIQGKSIQQIADELKTPEENIHRSITQVKNQMTVATQEMLEQYVSRTTARTEWLLSKILIAVEKQTEGEGEKFGPSRDLLQGALQIMKFQKELLMPDPKNPDVKVQINQTFNADNPLYNQALQNMQMEKFGTTVHQVDEPMVVELPPNLARLEDLATKYEVKEEDDTTPPEAV